MARDQKHFCVLFATNEDKDSLDMLASETWAVCDPKVERVTHGRLLITDHENDRHGKLLITDHENDRKDKVII
jgi:hypothetical protein